MRTPGDFLFVCLTTILTVAEELVPAAFTHFLAVPSVPSGDLLSLVGDLLFSISTMPKIDDSHTVDVDERNMEFARQNIIQNELKSRIRPLQTKAHDPLIPLEALGLNK